MFAPSESGREGMHDKHAMWLDDGIATLQILVNLFLMQAEVSFTRVQVVDSKRPKS